MFKALDKYESHISRNKSVHTVSNYTKHIARFLNYIEATNSDFDNIKQEVCLDYITELRDVYAPSTVHAHMTAVYNFMNYAFRKQEMKTIPFVDSSELYEYLPVIPRNAKKSLTVNQLRKMISSTNTLFEECLIRVFYDTAVRVSEIVSMKKSDIEILDDATVVSIVGKGKGGMTKQRFVQLTPTTYDKLQQLDKTNSHSDYVFTSGVTKNPFTTRRIMQIVNEIADRTGIENMTTHVFRKSLATNLIESGMQIEYISELLGHSNIETTRIYTDLGRNLRSKLSEHQISL